jgi:hypothetical protein
MGLQVSSYMRIASNKMLPKEVNKQDSEIPEKTVIRATPKTSWGGFQRTIYAKGEQSHRRSPHARPRAYADIDTTQVCSVTNHRVHKGQKRDTYRKRTFWQKKKLYGTTFLGQRISCFDRRKRRRSDSELYQVTRKRGPKDRTAEFVQVDGQR